jgi:hypothetical protein
MTYSSKVAKVLAIGMLVISSGFLFSVKTVLLFVIGSYSTSGKVTKTKQN